MARVARNMAQYDCIHWHGEWGWAPTHCVDVQFGEGLARVFLSIARSWEADHVLPGLWRVEGKTCERAGWEHNARAFAADISSFLNGTLFTDLSRFHERVSHAQLIS
eukprot:7646976-Pyramimonas_sp.AAC.1